MSFVASLATRSRPASRQEGDAREAVANLGRWLTDAHHRTSTEFGAEALAGVSKALLEPNDAYARAAYQQVCQLRLRNPGAEGPDIPANHAECGKEFRAVLECLQDALLGRMEERGRGRA